MMRSSNIVWISRISLSGLFVLTLQVPDLARLVLFVILLAGSFCCSGFVGALRALFASIVVATALVAIVVQVASQRQLNDFTITAAVLFAFAVLCGATCVSGLRTTKLHLSAQSTNELILLAPVFLIAFFMRRWMADAAPAEIFGLFGSEDNAAWISVARGFANDDISAAGLTHPTALSPAVGPLTGFVSFFTGFGTKTIDLPPHVQALETVRNCFALLILSGAVVAGALTTHVRKYRQKVSLWRVGLVSSLAVIAEAMLLTSLFTEHGFLSYMGSISFVLLTLEYSVNLRETESNASHISTIMIVLLALGISTHWWGTAPVGGLIVLIVVCRYLRQQFAWNGASYMVIGVVVVSSVAVLNQLRSLIIGDSIPTWVFAATGTVPLPSPLAILVSVVVVVLVIEHRVIRGSDTTDQMSIAEQLLVIISVYAMTIWAISVIRTGAENYAANKIVYMLLPVSAPLWFMLSSRTAQREELSIHLLRVVTALFVIALLSNSWLYLRGPQLVKASIASSQVIAALDRDPYAIVLCLHSNEESRIQAYVCSRFAQGLSRSESPFTANWLNAIVYPDRTPNGVMVPEEQTSGGRALIELRKVVAEGKRKISIVVFPDVEFDPGSFEWDDNFWWLKDVPWEKVTIVR